MEPMASYPQWPSSADVSLLRSALVEGDPSPSTFRHPLPPGVVDVILEKACYWVCEEVMNEEPVHGVGDANLLYLATGALHVSVKMVKIKLDSHDQGWSSFPQVCALPFCALAAQNHMYKLFSKQLSTLKGTFVLFSK